MELLKSVKVKLAGLNTAAGWRHSSVSLRPPTVHPEAEEEVLLETRLFSRHNTQQRTAAASGRLTGSSSLS